MKEKTITIPYEEYQELCRIQKWSEDYKKTVFVVKHHETNSFELRWWEVYSNDEYVKEVNEELGKLYLSREEGDILKDMNANLLNEVNDLKKEPRYNMLYSTLLFFNFVWILAYVIGEYILK